MEGPGRSDGPVTGSQEVQLTGGFCVKGSSTDAELKNRELTADIGEDSFKNDLRKI